MLENLILLIGITLMYSTPLIFGALGGVISERSGVTNIGIEGMMVIGAVAGATASYFTGNPWIGFLAAGVCGGLIALLHAVASVRFAADQTISGVAINMLAPGLALFACRYFFDGAAMTPIAPKLPKIFGSKGLAGTVFSNLNVNVTTVLALL
ncbi:MAG: ABC transporter permease, partial [Atopobiaceae bacterium]|nr:ABC transporter permease [Atopobiaceae bacterium]